MRRSIWKQLEGYKRLPRLHGHTPSCREQSPRYWPSHPSPPWLRRRFWAQPPTTWSHRYPREGGIRGPCSCRFGQFFWWPKRSRQGGVTAPALPWQIGLLLSFTFSIPGSGWKRVISRKSSESNVRMASAPHSWTKLCWPQSNGMNKKINNRHQSPMKNIGELCPPCWFVVDNHLWNSVTGYWSTIVLYKRLSHMILHENVRCLINNPNLELLGWRRTTQSFFSSGEKLSFRPFLPFAQLSLCSLTNCP